jgi:hypothetical protein
MKTTARKRHDLAMKIVKILIESDLSITQQLIVIENVRKKLDFCRKTGAEMNQLSLEL